MKLSRTDLGPLLTIVAGGVIGASLSFSLLGRSPAVDVPAPDLLLGIEVKGSPVVTAASIEVNGIVITPVVAPSATAEAAQQGGASGGASDQSQRQLAEDTEEEARRLERLARETDDPQLDQQLMDAARRLQEAAAEMRRSASASGEPRNR